MKTLKMTLFVGLNDKDSKIQEIETDVAKELIYYILLKNELDCTLSLNNGIYTHRDSQTVTVENSFKIELLCFENQFTFIKKVKSISNMLKECLNQESVAVVREYLDCELW